MNKVKSKPGFTLLELLVAVTIFAMASIISVLTVIQINNLNTLNQQKENMQTEAQNVAQFIKEVSRGGSDFKYTLIDCAAYKRPEFNCQIGLDQDLVDPNLLDPRFVHPSTIPAAQESLWQDLVNLTDRYIYAMTTLSFKSQDGLYYYLFNQHNTMRVLIYDPANNVKEIHNLMSNDFIIGGKAGFFAEDKVDGIDQASLEAAPGNIWGVTVPITVQSIDFEITLVPRTGSTSYDELEYAAQWKDSLGNLQTDWKTLNQPFIQRFKSPQSSSLNLLYPLDVHLGK